ncbi:beta-N-acetylhexosaminidase [Roseibium algae]|uniref:beta-N-acetylhexosaminidase n=1 Tax=Roseibium algae TaxID=3123038 RepID=A0ABU8THV4_9HYPH
MVTLPFVLENSWYPIEGDLAGGFSFVLHNMSGAEISNFRLIYTSLTRVTDEAVCQNATLLRRNANFHEFGPPEGFKLAPGDSWAFKVDGLHRSAKHRTDGAKSAYVTLSDGTHKPCAIGDLMLEGRHSEPAPKLLPDGKVSEPFFLQPWPKKTSLGKGDSYPVALFLKSATSDEKSSVQKVQTLYQRLFAADHVPFALSPVHEGRELVLRKTNTLANEEYKLTFSETEVALTYTMESGLQYGLTTLAQLLHGARQDPETFSFPSSGTIDDTPRYGWRGCHLDVSRQFYPTADVTRLIDILAWYKMNIFHWHLTDDEAWRLEIKAYPELTTIGATRGPDEILLPQLGNGAEIVSGFYSQDEVKAVVAHAAHLGLEVVPEVDIPGHCTAVLAIFGNLSDGQEAPDSYHSVQGFPNNALNPAIEATYAFLATVFDEMASLFPSRYVHIGGDEVADGSWLASPKAKKLMEQEGLEGTFGLQSYFMKRVQQMLLERGKCLAGWDEVSHGGGVSPEGTLLMAWQNPDVGIDLARKGYDVVMTPGQAYYLDMVQDDAWQEPGASWAGTVPPEHSYHYEAEGDFPEDLRPRLKGIQACIWSENFLSHDYFNRLVFPRLCAVAEAGWSPKDAKDWLRFAAIAPYAPKL